MFGHMLKTDRTNGTFCSLRLNEPMLKKQSSHFLTNAWT